MSHARTQIRQAVIALLKGNTGAGNNVFEARVYPIDDPKLPALLVYTKLKRWASNPCRARAPSSGNCA